MADYYLRGVKRAEVTGTAAIPCPDMPPSVAAVLGLEVHRTARHEAVVNLLRGLRAEGAALQIAPARAHAGCGMGGGRPKPFALPLFP